MWKSVELLSGPESLWLYKDHLLSLNCTFPSHQMKEALSEIIQLATVDSEPWVLMVADILKSFPETGSLNLDLEEQNPNVQDILGELREKGGECVWLPMFCDSSCGYDYFINLMRALLREYLCYPNGIQAVSPRWQLAPATTAVIWSLDWVNTRDKQHVYKLIAG